MITDSESPTYAKISLNLLTIGLLLTGLYLGKNILVPFFFAILLATLLHPIVCFLSGKRCNRILAIVLAILVTLFAIGVIIYFLSSQIGNFLQDVPEIKFKLRELAAMMKVWVHDHFNIAIQEQDAYLEETTEKMSNGSGSIVQSTFLTLTELVSYLIFLPIYTFLILYHKEIILHFLTTIFKGNEKETVAQVLFEAQSISQSYLIGLMIETAIVFTLNTTGFLLLGIKYAFFLALLSALLNIVPYIGMIMANLFCMLVTLVSNDDPFMAVWVSVTLTAVQLVDNNILMPFIVGSKIKINSLAIILAVLTGGAICGIPGMFLAIPGLALIKVVFERVESLKPWAILLSDEQNQNPYDRNFLTRAIQRARVKKQKETELEKQLKEQAKANKKD
jgi:predicted PurR-regulated permease PerM